MCYKIKKKTMAATSRSWPKSLRNKKYKINECHQQMKS